MRTIATVALFAVLSTLTPSLASADDLDGLEDIKIETTSAVPAPAVTPRRDPATAGTLTGRRPVDLRAQDDDEGHRFLVPTPAPRRHHGRRRHHGNDSASAIPTFPSR